MVAESDVTDVTRTLDEITEEISKIQGDDKMNGTIASGQRGVISDIEKLKKIAQILETVGQAILPAVVEGQTSAQKQVQSAGGSVANSGSIEPGNILPKGLKLLQHHSAIASNLNDIQPPLPVALTLSETPSNAIPVLSETE